jgi:hypothetical protein
LWFLAVLLAFSTVYAVVRTVLPTVRVRCLRFHAGSSRCVAARLTKWVEALGWLPRWVEANSPIRWMGSGDGEGPFSSVAQIQQHLSHHPDVSELHQHGEGDGW